jgi:alanyl-tRNA synthetase
MTADLLRKKYLDFFKSKKHKIVESDSLVPKDDPTVLFTPAGMNQFKKEFLGFDSGFKRAATSQRCLRTDDLEKVGKTAFHHTFFEMLGNFSFGGYFKEEAIPWAWEFLTEELKIDQEKLWVSVYTDDNKAYSIWKDVIKIPAHKIIKLGDKENFWPSEAKLKGPNGPCGPCSEIFFDFGEDVGCKEPACDPSCSCGRFSEVWNLVFTQFNRKEGGKLEPLPNKNIDTGMGLERLAAVMQGKHSNFETDLFEPIVKEITEGIKQGVSPLAPSAVEGKGTVPEKELIYAIADHTRAVVFCIYDGVLPSNESRGYIVRKIIRKSVLHLRTLGIKQPFFNKLVPVVAEVMKGPYPELLKRQEDIAQIILAEEKKFINTLNEAPKIIELTLASYSPSKATTEAVKIKLGKVAFNLYDTYGIPFELTQDLALKKGFEISAGAFNENMKEQKNRSKSQSAMKGDVFAVKDLDYGIKETKFLGYEDHEVKGKICKIFKDGAEAKKIARGDEAQIILERSVFYAESGGQVGDTGELIKGKNIFEVTDTRKTGKVILHIGKVKEGSFERSDFVDAKVDLERRMAIARNHTATHMLQSALRKVLGGHVKQQGSLVASDRLRFDFTHFKGLDKEQINRVEEIVNNGILENHALTKKEMTLAAARKTGALAFFGEKYEGKVRVVSIADFSKELCGGTHLESTGQIGLFKIIREGSVAQGVRRIEAVTGKEAYKAIKQEEEVVSDIALALNIPEDKIIPELERKLSRIRELEKQLSAKISETLKSSIDDVLKTAQVINGINFINTVAPDADAARKAVDLIKQKAASMSLIAVSTGNNLDGQVFLVVGLTQDLVDKGVDACALIKQIAPEIGGSGGGRKDFAQAGGKLPDKLNSALEKLKNIISGLKV